ncbi:MAG: thiamine pyrophosphate-dependent enzyme, partial [Armatimonadota bacterium]
IAMGNSFAQNATYAFAPNLYDGKTLLHINIDPDEIGKVYKPTVGLISDIKPAVIAISKALEGRVDPRPVTKIVTDKYIDHPLEPTNGSMHPAALSRAISEMLPENSVILGDAGAHMLWLNCHLSLTKGQLYQNPGSFGPMASHVNGALGIKCANPARTVVCGCGDGDYLMAGFELLTAVEYDIPVIWVIFNNGEFNIIKQFMVNMYGDHAYMRFANPDYMKYAEACGALGYKAETVEEFKAAFASALASGRPAVIDAVVESEVYPPFNMGRV